MKDIMYSFINNINEKKMMTQFLENIFEYRGIKDYNYIFRMVLGDDEIIIDIYDNVTDNRFNRYIFSFKGNEDVFVSVFEDNNVYVNYINVYNAEDRESKLLKLAYLFKIKNNKKMVEYAKEFLDLEFVELLGECINKNLNI